MLFSSSSSLRHSNHAFFHRRFLSLSPLHNFSISPQWMFLLFLLVFFLLRPSFHSCLICSGCVIRNPSGNCFQIKETQSMTQFYSGMKLRPEIRKNMKNTHTWTSFHTHTQQNGLLDITVRIVTFSGRRESSTDIKWKNKQNKQTPNKTGLKKMNGEIRHMFVLEFFFCYQYLCSLFSNS